MVGQESHEGVGHLAPPLPNDGWVLVQNKRNSQGKNFLVDRNGQEFSSNPPGSVTHNGVNGKEKKVTFAMENTPGPCNVPCKKSPPPSPTKNTKTRGQLTTASSTTPTCTYACTSPPARSTPEEPTTPQDGPQWYQGAQAGVRGQPMTTKGQATAISTHASCTRTQKNRTNGFHDDDDPDGSDEGACVFSFQEVAQELTLHSPLHMIGEGGVRFRAKCCHSAPT